MREMMERAETSETRDVREDDLRDVLLAFYAELENDPLLAGYFATLDMAEHIPRIEAFWSTIAFRTRRYADNAFAPHQKLPGLTPEHFSRWLSTWESVLDARFSGPATEVLKSAAQRIAYSMQLRLGIAPYASPGAERRS